MAADRPTDVEIIRTLSSAALVLSASHLSSAPNHPSHPASSRPVFYYYVLERSPFLLSDSVYQLLGRPAGQLPEPKDADELRPENDVKFKFKFNCITRPPVIVFTALRRRDPSHECQNASNRRVIVALPKRTIRAITGN